MVTRMTMIIIQPLWHLATEYLQRSHIILIKNFTIHIVFSSRNIAFWDSLECFINENTNSRCHVSVDRKIVSSIQIIAITLYVYNKYIMINTIQSVCLFYISTSSIFTLLPLSNALAVALSDLDLADCVKEGM